MRVHEKFNYNSNFGRSTVDIKCPYCSAITTAFVWSLAGSGKKCKCGALHNNYGLTHEPKLNKKTNETRNRH